jgi:hypothetical protein
MRYFDKVPNKFAAYDSDKFLQGGFRVVPPAPWPAAAASSARTWC